MEPRCALFAAVILALRTVASYGATLYVDLNSPAPTWPFSSWNTAATTIQEAVDASEAGDQILVTNGVYQVGSRVVTGSLNNRVAVNKAVTVQSVNGPAVTLICGEQVSGVTNGDTAIRCVYLTNDATLIGFTLTNGATRGAGAPTAERTGGGVYCRAASAVVSNCVIVGNAAYGSGGGGFQGTFFGCVLVGNTATNGGGGASCSLTDCVLAGNRAAGVGGGTSSAALSNCTLITNWAGVAGGGASTGGLTNCILKGNTAFAGGGANAGVLLRCIVENNFAVTNGGGVLSSMAANCALLGNTAQFGGGSYAGNLTNCTITGNSARAYGGGSFSGMLRNCIVHYNSAPIGSNHYNLSIVEYCCLSPLPEYGAGNISAEPQLASAFCLTTTSPCRGAGAAAYAKGTDVHGQPWATPPAIGCDEFYSDTPAGSLNVFIRAGYTNVVVGQALNFFADISGTATSNFWSFGDGTSATNRIFSNHTWATPGNYPLVVRAYNQSNPGGISSTAIVHVIGTQVHYVSANSPNSAPPYSSWLTAAHTIQEAIEAATAAGALILVTNGLYNTGAQWFYGTMSNRVAVTKPLTVRSVNGPAVTTIQGRQVSGMTNGNGALRCVYLADGASFQGFTLTNGATTVTGDLLLEQSGGAVWCESPSAVVSNCVLTGNQASYNGGGTYSGTLINCTFTGNSAAAGGGSHSSTLLNCALTANRSYDGGGANNSVLNNCTLIGNSATNVPYATPGSGGGASHCSLRDCTLTGNSAMYAGGGAVYGWLSNCVLLNNFAVNPDAYPRGGGTLQANLTNCTLIGNYCSLNGGAVSDGILQNCTLMSNWAGHIGGGAVSSTLLQCTLTGNSASNAGGGAYYCTLVDSSVTGNSASNGAGVASATLAGCLLAGNLASGDGGGADSSTITNCFLRNNTASRSGGGASASTLHNSSLYGNRASTHGGGSFNGKLNNCTLIANFASAAGGGDYGGMLTNCLVYHNLAAIGTNYETSTFEYSCTAPLPATGQGNIDSDPQLADSFHLSAGSPCRFKGGAAGLTGTDLDGNTWATPPPIGCDEFGTGTAQGSLNVVVQASHTNVAPAFPVDFNASINGNATAQRWDFGDTMIVSNRPCISHSWVIPGEYTVFCTVYNETHPGGVTASLPVHVVAQPVHYVALSNSTPMAPYNSWSTAATNIQDAASAATVAGAMVLVSNGVYGAGGRAVSSPLSNRVAVTLPLVLRSINGPAVTTIKGESGTRCVYLTNRAALVGFTLTGGNAYFFGNNDITASGGAVWCASPSVLVSNCVLATNLALYYGGGAYSGTLRDCSIRNNKGYWGGGVYKGTLANCEVISNTAFNEFVVNSYGGGVYGGFLERCTVSGNSAGSDGGGAVFAILRSCLVTSNESGYYTGGVVECDLQNCTVIGNKGGYRGGASYGTVRNCILYDNRASSAPENANFYSSTLNNSCTIPLAPGADNFTNAPLFVNASAGNFHLASNSPCINAGKNVEEMGAIDFDGSPRIAGATVDVGAFEFQFPSSLLSYAWAQRYGFATDGSADYADVDGDTMNNWQEWIAGTNPTNASSKLQAQSLVVSPPALLLTWESQTNRSYFVDRAHSLDSAVPFTTIGTNIPGLPGLTTFRVPIGPAPRAFYRVGIAPASLSTFRLQPPRLVPISATLTWTSVTNRFYFIERSINLTDSPAFDIIATNLPGLFGITTFTDSNAPADGPAFYRVGVHQ